MKLFYIVFFTLLAGNSWANHLGEPLACYDLVQKEISLVEQKPFISKLDVGVDSGVAMGSAIAFMPTMGASLPIGLGVIAGRNMIRSVHRDVSVGSKQWVLQLIAESNQYLTASRPKASGEKGNTAIDDSQYSALKTLWLRIDNPFSAKYSLEEVASGVLAATQDNEFCEDPRNFRLVHFKDYVLNQLNEATYPS